jgi:hypothetical protein
MLKFILSCRLLGVFFNLGLLVFCQLSVLATTLFGGAVCLLLLNITYNGRTALVPVAEVVDLLSKDLPGVLAVLTAGPGSLRLDDDAGREVL